MKNYLLFALLLSSLYSYSQITISNSDLPSPGDTIRISNAIEFLADPSETGANYTWDYSYLEGTDQYIDSFISPTDAPLVHTLVFNLPWDPDKATVAIMTDGVG